MTIEVVSYRVDALTKDLSRVEGTVVGMDKKIDGLGESLLLLARLEERHQTVATALNAGVVAMAALEIRLAEVEQKMPGLVEMRAWVIGGVLSVVAVVGVAAAKLLIQ